MERMHIISILLPILLLVTLGYVLLRIHFLDEVFFRNCAKLTYWRGIPALRLLRLPMLASIFRHLGAFHW